jgi:cell division protease FtsH
MEHEARIGQRRQQVELVPYSTFQKYLEDKRAAEMLVYRKLSTGAADELDKATSIARGMITRYGMDTELEQMTYETEPDPHMAGTPGMMPQIRAYSEATAREIDCAIRKGVDDAFQRATAILTRRSATLDTTARRLLQPETLTAEELAPLCADSPPPETD